MKSNNIIFADLSTYSPKQSIAFYEYVFGWKYYKDKDYYLAYKGHQEIVGLYETPEKFKQMRMPHFWMTYIQVDNVAKAVEKAKELGGIIEMVQVDNFIGPVALIRDPQGAGFTVCEGGKLQSTRTQNKVGTLIWNELHISNAATIIPFYQGVFDWTFAEKNNNQFEIYNNKHDYLADAIEVPNESKSKYEYWACTFAVEDLQNTRNKIIEYGGSVLKDEGTRILFADNSGQAFFYIQEVV